MATRLFHLATVCVALLLASPARAQDQPWTSEKLSVEALEKAREELKPKLEQPAKDADDAQKSAWEAAKSRDQLLSRLIRALKELAHAQQPQTFEAHATRRQTELAALRKTAPESLPSEIRESKELQPYDKAAREARSKRDAKTAQLASMDEQLKDIDQTRAAIPGRRTELRAITKSLGDTKPGTPEAFRADNVALELRLLKEQEADASVVHAYLEAERSAVRVDLDYANEVARRAEKLLTDARTKHAEWATREVERKKQAAARETAKAKGLKGQPILQFRANMNARISTLGGEITTAETKLGRIKDASEREQQRLERYQKTHDLIDRQVGGRGTISSSAAQTLNKTLKGAESAREKIVTTAAPRAAAAQNRLLGRLGPMEEEEWNLSGPPAEMQPWLDLIATVPESQAAAARDEFNKLVLEKDGLRSKLRKLIGLLEKQNTHYATLAETYAAQTTALAKTEALIRGHIYWVRTEDRLGVALFENGWKELKGLYAFYTEPEFTAELREAVADQPAALAIGSTIFIVLLVGASLAARRLRAGPLNAPVAGHRLGPGTRDAARLLLHASAPSLVLLLAAGVLVRFSLPGRIVMPLDHALEAIALVLFIQRLAWGLLREDGLLVTHFDLNPEVTRQVLRSVRIVTVSMMVFHVPELALEKAADTDVLGRLFGTAYRTARILAIVLLIRPRRPFVRAFVRGNAGGLRVAAAICPLIVIVCTLVVAMDFLGYKYGARFFNDQILEIFLLCMILRGVYGGFNQISDRVVVRMRERAFKELGGSQAITDSEEMARQLSRVITVLTLVAATAFLISSWDLNDTYGSVLREWTIASFNGGVRINALDVIKAVGFLVGAHLFSSNLGGLFELIVFPIFGQIHRGTRYVVIALTRYGILLVGYLGALVSLQFSFSSIGWLLTAASVGLGFGLQEIVANFVSGLILLIEQPVRVGDTITVDQTGGTIDKITIRATMVTNWDQKTIIIPNKSFITQNVVNWTRNNTISRRRIDVPVAHGCPAEKVLSVLADVATKHESVKSFPSPRIWLDSFGDNAINYVVYVYTDISDGLSTLSELRQAIYERFAIEGIRIPVPQRDIRIRPDSSNADFDIAPPTELTAPKPNQETAAEGAEPDSDGDDDGDDS